MDRVKSQAAVVSQLLFDPKTAGTYKDALTLTGKIFKEIALLAWLLICSILVLGAWFSDTAVSAGQKTRTWWQVQQAGTADGNQTAAATGQAFLDASQNSANFLLDKAREQLGLDKIERPVKKSEVETALPPTKTVANNVSTTTSAVADKVTAIAKDAKEAVDKTVSNVKESSDASAPEKH